MNTVEFEWDSTESFEPELPLREWQYGMDQEGGHAVSAAGLPASFVVRTQETLDLVLRVKESEWSDCRAFLRAGMAGVEITMTVADNPPVDVYFVTPVAGEAYQTDRDPSFPRVLDVAITVRASDGGDIDLVFYPEDDS
jgi:hypothetical protein